MSVVCLLVCRATGGTDDFAALDVNMAKSIRSKWRRKMRAIKRIRYGVKELDRLKKMLVNAGEIEVKEDGEIEHVCLGIYSSLLIFSIPH